MSIKTLLRNFWLLMTAILVILNITTQRIALDRVTQNMEQDIQKSILASESGIEDILTMTDNYVYEHYYTDSPYSLHRLIDTYYRGKSAADRIEAEQSIENIIASINQWSEDISFTMMYLDNGEDSRWFESGNGDSYPVRGQIHEDVEKQELLKNIKRYMIYSFEGKNYMLRTLRLENCYFICCVNQKKIEEILRNAAFSEDSILVAADENGQVFYSDSREVTELDPTRDGSYIQVNGRYYLQSGHTSAHTGYYFGVLTPRDALFREISGIMVAFIVAFFGMALIIGATYYYFHRYMEQPLSGLVAGMKEVEEGDMELTVANESHIEEFRNVTDSFNHMVRRIQDLKIENYEAELKIQKANLQYLQTQIKPHFYANVLNIIYSLAQVRDFDTIQRTARACVTYSRYMFRDAEELVSLSREMECIRAYMEIQEIRYQRMVQLNTDVPEELMEVLIPPFAIQSFIENSVKYAFATKKNCRISVTVFLDEAGENLHILVRDNGVGYPEELLGDKWKNHRLEEHIGLNNVSSRLRLLYEDQADMWLSNDKGAVTEITIPYIDLSVEDDESF